MKQKICLVTGANGGIGKEIALGLAVAGAHVIMVCRNEAKGRAALEAIEAMSGSSAIDLLIADLSSQADIRALAKKIHAQYTHLDVLINNAGLVLPKKTFSIDNIEMTLATNHLAPFLLSNLLLDLLQKSAPSRIINISSAIHRWGKIDLDDLQYTRRKYHFMKAYAQSKLLMNIVSFELARKLQGSGVTVNCVHPGAVKTNLGSSSNNSMLLKILDRMIKFFFISPNEAAKAPLYLALSPEIQNVTGTYFIKSKPTRANAISYDPLFAKQVWESSEKLLIK
jgi:NAD(P)-dependent dehydrogenase (short-subunit alcohol dehydrogenase family)